PDRASPRQRRNERPSLGLLRCSSDPFCSGCSERNRLRFGARRGRSSERQSDHGRTLPPAVGVEESTVALQLASEAVPVPVGDCRSCMSEISISPSLTHSCRVEEGFKLSHHHLG